MKKFFVQIILLYCMLMGGCPGMSEGNQSETDQWFQPSPTPVAMTATPEPTITVTPEPTITMAEEPVPTNTAEVTVLPEKTDDMPEFSFRLGENGETIYEVPSCFMDKNGLLCVSLKTVYDKNEEFCEVEKSYYLPKGTLYRTTETMPRKDTVQQFRNSVIEQNYITLAYEPIVYKTISGYVWTKDGRLVKAADLLGEDYGSKFVCTGKEDYIPVTAGEKIKADFYFSWFSDIAGILFLDGNDRMVDSYSFNSATSVKDQFLYVPEGAEKMHLTLFINQKYRLEREVSLVGADLASIAEEEYQTQAKEVFLDQEKNNVNKYNLDKAYITFVLDDCRPDMDRIADIFAEQKVPLCIAAVYENMLFSASKGTETRREVCERVVAAGGEVLAHDGEVITEDLLKDYNEIAKHFFEDKWTLEQMGFEVNGIILAGGAGQVVGHEMTDLWARAHYKYSDLYGEAKYGEPYYHRRFWLGNAQDNYQQVISEAVREKEWVVFYLHDLKEVNAEKLQEILQYVMSLPEDQIEVVTYSELYNKMWE